MKRPPRWHLVTAVAVGAAAFTAAAMPDSTWDGTVTVEQKEAALDACLTHLATTYGLSDTAIAVCITLADLPCDTRGDYPGIEFCWQIQRDEEYRRTHHG